MPNILSLYSPIRCTDRRRHAQAGATMIEFNIVATILLTMGLLLIEIAYWQITQQIAKVALLEAARAGSTQQRLPDVINDTFTQVLRPRLGSTSRPTWHELKKSHGFAPWQIEIRDPDDTTTLRLHLTYLHRPLTPILRWISKELETPASNPCTTQAYRNGMLAMVLSIQIEMHSQPTPEPEQLRLTHSKDKPIVYGKNDCLT